MSSRKNPYAKPDRSTRAPRRTRATPARSVFKLEEIDQRTRLKRPGHARARPRGGAGELDRCTSRPSKVGASGRSLAVGPRAAHGDRRSRPERSTLVQGDAPSRSPNAVARCSRPTTSSCPTWRRARPATASLTRRRSYELRMRALAAAATLGQSARGSFVGKIFMSDDLPTRPLGAAQAPLRDRPHLETRRDVRSVEHRGLPSSGSEKRA